MCPVVVIIGEELAEQPPQVLLVQHDHVIKQFASATADPALGYAVLPRALKRGPYWLNLHAAERAAHLGREARVPVQ
jgi:hypothetical protein